jgi:Family of unknown function (DUF6326)
MRNRGVHDSEFSGGLKIAMMDKRNALAFEDIKVHVRFKLFALWSSVMFFYIYGDYFELYQPGKLQEIIAGRMPFGAISQGALLGMAAVMIIPSLMPFLSLVLPAGANRWMNIVFGAVYSVIMILAIRGGWHFYILFGLIEIILTILIVWYAWTWPKQPTR